MPTRKPKSDGRVAKAVQESLLMLTEQQQTMLSLAQMALAQGDKKTAARIIRDLMTHNTAIAKTLTAMVWVDPGEAEKIINQYLHQQEKKL